MKVFTKKEGRISFEGWMKIAGIGAALLVFAILYTMPTPTAMTGQGKSALAVFAMVFILWVTQAIPTYASSLVAMVMLVMTGGWSCFLYRSSAPRRTGR